MKKLQTPLFLIFIGILLCVASCKKEQPDPPPDLPPLTNVGAMTFGCYVNGEPWVAQIYAFSPTEIPIVATYSLSKKQLIISTTKLEKDKSRENIYLLVNNIHKNSIGDTLLNSLDRTMSSYNFYCKDNIRNIDFYLDQILTNNVIITFFDLEKRIASGNFKFSIYPINCPDEVVHITEGRFDVLFSIVE